FPSHSHVDGRPFHGLIRRDPGEPNRATRPWRITRTRHAAGGFSVHHHRRPILRHFRPADDESDQLFPRPRGGRAPERYFTDEIFLVELCSPAHTRFVRSAKGI